MVVGIVCFYFLSPFCLSVSSKFSTLNNYCLYNKQKKFLFQKTMKERTLGWKSGALFFSCAANYLVVGLQGITLISKQKGPELTGSISKMEWFSKMYGRTGQAIPFVLFFVPYFCLPTMCQAPWHRQIKHSSHSLHGAYNTGCSKKWTDVYPIIQSSAWQVLWWEHKEGT